VYGFQRLGRSSIGNNKRMPSERTQPYHKRICMLGKCICTLKHTGSRSSQSTSAACVYIQQRQCQQANPTPTAHQRHTCASPRHTHPQRMHVLSARRSMQPAVPTLYVSHHNTNMLTAPYHRVRYTVTLFVNKLSTYGPCSTSSVAAAPTSCHMQHHPAKCVRRLPAAGAQAPDACLAQLAAAAHHTWHSRLLLHTVPGANGCCCTS
jgi:hypothetical protein